MTGKGNCPEQGAELRRQAEEIAGGKNTARSPEYLESQLPETRQTLHELQVHQIELEMQNEELRRTQTELDASRARYFDLYDLAPVGYVTLSEKGLILEANLTAATLLGVAKSALVKQPITRFILPEDQDIYYRHRKQIFAAYAADATSSRQASTLRLRPGPTGEAQVCELRMVKMDGTVFWGQLAATAAQNPSILRPGSLQLRSGQAAQANSGQEADGTPVYRVVLNDITEHKRAEEALQESQQRWQFALEGSGDGVWDWDCQTNRVFYSPQWKVMLGYGEEDIGDTLDEWDQRVHPDDRKQCYEDMERHLNGKTNFYTNEHRVLCQDGSYKWVLDRRKVIQRAEDGKPLRVIGTYTDLTDRKQMEKELLRAHNLESLGVLAGGIAHDFNNLMAIVQGYIELTLMDLPPDHVSRPRLLTAMRSVEQTKDLTGRLITFSRGGGPYGEIFDVAEIIRYTVQKTVKGTNVRVKPDFMENLWPAEIDEIQMQQCFYNLTTNAVEAMPEGGNLTILAENALIPDGAVLDLKKGAYLKITFTDEGIGIPEEHLSKVFDPYFTTKKMAAQKGIGLGLAVCYSVLKKHDGHITVKSQPGEGASFVLYLPARADLAKEKEVKKRVPTGTVRILIMDDEPRIREIERVYLERSGYEVTDVEEGQEAIDAYQKALDSGNPFDLVILDLKVRQGLGGQLAMERLLKIDPSIMAIIASAYVDDPAIENYADYGFQGALKKPFKGEEMKSLVEKILHG